MTTLSLHYCIQRDKFPILDKFKEIVGAKAESKTIVELMESFVKEHEKKSEEQKATNIQEPKSNIDLLIMEKEELELYILQLSTGLDLKEYKEELAKIQKQAKQIQAKANQIERISNEAWKEAMKPDAESHKERRMRQLKESLDKEVAQKPLIHPETQGAAAC